MQKIHKEEIRLRINKQQRDAYELVKYLKAANDRKIVSYVISTSVKVKNGKYEPIVEIKQLPEIRLGHGISDDEEAFMKVVNIDNLEE